MTTYKKTKAGEEFERALEIVKKRIEKQLRLNGKLEDGQLVRLTITRRGGIMASTWNEGELIECFMFHPNGKFRN